VSLPLYGLMPLPLIPVGATGDRPAPLGGGAPATRRCGRCLAQFPGDPDADPVVIPEFWMCPPCREALLGTRAGRDVPSNSSRPGHATR
jgi:hypothetical protein